jgi:hypothetical protein
MRVIYGLASPRYHAGMHNFRSYILLLDALVRVCVHFASFLPFL